MESYRTQAVPVVIGAAIVSDILAGALSSDSPPSDVTDDVGSGPFDWLQSGRDGHGGVEFVAAVEDRLHSRRSDTPPAATPEALRFAFYGRMSTCEFQDVTTSWAWQRAVAEELVERFGAIVVEFFDKGRSRRWAWPDRPAAAALLAAARRPDRGFDAVVVGEYERAFCGDQFLQVAAELAAVCRCGCPRQGVRSTSAVRCTRR